MTVFGYKRKKGGCGKRSRISGLQVIRRTFLNVNDFFWFPLWYANVSLCIVLIKITKCFENKTCMILSYNNDVLPHSGPTLSLYILFTKMTKCFENETCMILSSDNDVLMLQGQLYHCLFFWQNGQMLWR